MTAKSYRSGAVLFSGKPPKKINTWHQFVQTTFYCKYIAIVCARTPAAAKRKIEAAIRRDRMEHFSKFVYDGSVKFDAAKYRVRPAFEIMSYRSA